MSPIYALKRKSAHMSCEWGHTLPYTSQNTHMYSEFLIIQDLMHPGFAEQLPITEAAQK